MQKQKNINFKRRLMVAGFAALSFAMLVPVASSYAWGPDRPTYTMKKPADHPTFNSITNNNIIGDERNFVRIREVGSKQYTNEVKIKAGKTYEVYIFFHNNAASNLNKSGKGIADNVKVSTVFPNTVNSSKKGTISATIESSNASPKKVWDEAFMTTDSKSDIELKYVASTARIYNEGKLNGSLLDTVLFTKGIYIGYNKLSGMLPGCSEYSGHILYHLRATQASSKVSKTASLDGTNFFSSVTAKPGDTVTYKVTFVNNGSKDLTNVTFRDKLPTGVTLVPGSVKLYDDATKKTVSVSDAVVLNGVNKGLFGEGVTGTLTYKVTLNKDIVSNGNCGTNEFKNTMHVTTDQTGTATATSTIKVEKVCEDEPEPEPDPCKNEDGSIKSECCDKEEYKNEPACKPSEDDPCKNEDGSIRSECCDKEEYKNEPACKPSEEDPCKYEDGSFNKDCCDRPEYKDTKACKEDTTTPTKPVTELPNTGPGEIALAIVAAVCVVTGVSYWYRSQKEVKAMQKSVKEEGHSEHPHHK